MGKKNVMHDAGGKKIMHPADAIRRKAKKKKLNKMKESRHQHFEDKMLQRAPEDILLEIRQIKADHLRKTKNRIDIRKESIDRLTQMEVGYERMKDQVAEEHTKRQGEHKPSHYVDFEVLKVHRKASIFYHPVNNPYGAPPSGQTLMYRHPDGSVKREPPSLDAPVPDAAMGQGQGGDSDGSGSSGSDEDSEDDDADPLLPDSLPGVVFASSSSASAGPDLPPLPPGAPPLPGGPPPLPGGQPPMPLGQPPMPFGHPPLPMGQPPMPLGQPPMPLGAFGQQLMLGQPPLPFGAPMLPFGQDMSQAAFMADLANAGFQVPGLVPPGPPPKPGALVPPGPPPKGKGKDKGKDKGKGKDKDKNNGKGKGKGKEASEPLPPAKVESEPAKAEAVSVDLAKAPAPPPKKAAAAPAAIRLACNFMPTTLRTKKVSQVAGGVMQATSSSLSMGRRQNLISTQVPRVSEKVDVDDAFDDFMNQLDD